MAGYASVAVEFDARTFGAGGGARGDVAAGVSGGGGAGRRGGAGADRGGSQCDSSIAEGDGLARDGAAGAVLCLLRTRVVCSIEGGANTLSKVRSGSSGAGCDIDGGSRAGAGADGGKNCSGRGCPRRGESGGVISGNCGARARRCAGIQCLQD